MDVARGAGIAESTISEVLAGKRRLTSRQVEKLGTYFHVSPAVFLPEVEYGRNRRRAPRRPRVERITASGGG